jgi:hypothetical protein
MADTPKLIVFPGGGERTKSQDVDNSWLRHYGERLIGLSEDKESNVRAFGMCIVFEDGGVGTSFDGWNMLGLLSGIEWLKNRVLLDLNEYE